MVSYCVDLTSVYSFTIGKFVLASVSASLYYFAESNCFITVKDHKENFLNHPKSTSHQPSKEWAWKNKQNDPW